MATEGSAVPSRPSASGACALKRRRGCPTRRCLRVGLRCHPEVAVATEGSAVPFELSFRPLRRAATCSPAFAPQRERSLRAKKRAQRLGIFPLPISRSSHSPGAAPCFKVHAQPRTRPTAVIPRSPWRPRDLLLAFDFRLFLAFCFQRRELRPAGCRRHGTRQRSESQVHSVRQEGFFTLSSFPKDSSHRDHRSSEHEPRFNHAARLFGIETGGAKD